MSTDVLAARSVPSAVAGQQLPASTAMGDYQEVILPSTSTHVWINQMRNNDMQHISPSSPPDTPSLYWGSEPSSAELTDQGLHSVFEDWDDDLEKVANLSASVIVEEDGSQTLLIPSDSPYFDPLTPHPHFGSTFAIDVQTAEADAVCDGMDTDNYQMPSVPRIPPNPVLKLKGPILHIKTSFLGPTSNSEQAERLSSMIPSPQPLIGGEDEISWNQRLYLKRPDVPFDCSCSLSAGDGSPMMEPWDDEPIWSPVVIPAFRSAPCF